MGKDGLNYYVIAFKGQSCESKIMLMEDKELDEADYHKRKKYKLDYYFYIEKVKDYIMPLNINIAKVDFDTYKFNSKQYRLANEVKVDGFSYDADNKKVLYGYTYVYAINKNGKFYDVVTGINIPSIIILRHTLLVFSHDFEEMIDNLEFIQKHKKLYKETICNIIKLLAIGQINMEKAEKEYKKRCLIYEQNRLKGVSEKSSDEINLEKYQKTEEFQKVEETKEKIKCLLNDINLYDN